MDQRGAHHAPAAVHRPHPEAVRRARIGVEGGVGSFSAQRPDAPDLDARCLRRHQQRGQAVVLGRVGLGAGKHEHMGV